MDKTSLQELEESAFVSRKYHQLSLIVSQKWQRHLHDAGERHEEKKARQASGHPARQPAAYDDNPGPRLQEQAGCQDYGAIHRPAQNYSLLNSNCIYYNFNHLQLFK